MVGITAHSLGCPSGTQPRHAQARTRPVSHHGVEDALEKLRILGLQGFVGVLQSSCQTEAQASRTALTHKSLHLFHYFTTTAAASKRAKPYAHFSS